MQTELIVFYYTAARDLIDAYETCRLSELYLWKESTILNKLLLEEMSWPEIKKALDDGITTVIIAAGSVEQHGPHLPEITDTVLGYQSAMELARRLGNALVAPVIRPGLSEHHMAFPGSITLRPEVFTGIVEDYISSYVRHGFKTIILISSHGGNTATLAKVAEDQAKKYEGVKIISGLSLSDMRPVVESLEKADDLPAGTYGSHACARETSVMLLFAPQLVDMSKAKCGYLGRLTDEVVQKVFTGGIASISENGILGDARPSNAERGARCFKAIQDKQEQVVRDKLG